MKQMVVLFALAAVACGSLVPVAQPPHHPAVVLDPHGRPLDTAEVIGARALHLQAKALEGHYAPLAHSVVAPVAHAHSVVAPLAHSVVAAPAAVSHQSRVDVRTSPAVVSHAVHAPVLAHAVHAAPVLAHAAPVLGHSAYGLAGHGHLLKKRSLSHIAYHAPIVAPSAVSHQSRVDVISSPAVVSHAVAPVVAHAAPVPTLWLRPSPTACTPHPWRIPPMPPPLAHGAYAAPLAHSYHSSPLVHGW
ncbi:hypothetical protein ACJJTC_014911 [Scirpophaga incertulas]